MLSLTLSEYDIKVLRTLNGEEIEGLYWGAAMAITCEDLKRAGYAKGLYEISDAGKRLLEELDGKEAS